MVTLSNIANNGNLVRYEKWCNYVDDLKNEVSKSGLIENERLAAEAIAKNFEKAVQKRIQSEKFGIFFSGGVDSTYIAYTCKKLKASFICYTVGIEGSKDIEISSKIAKELGFTHRKKVLSLKEMETLFEKTAKLLGKELIDIVSIGVGAVVLAGLELAEKDNIKSFFSGLGSEEIFAGYQRHEKAQNINEECWRGLKTTWMRDFRRDFAIGC